MRLTLDLLPALRHYNVGSDTNEQCLTSLHPACKTPSIRFHINHRLLIHRHTEFRRRESCPALLSAVTIISPNIFVYDAADDGGVARILYSIVLLNSTQSHSSLVQSGVNSVNRRGWANSPGFYWPVSKMVILTMIPIILKKIYK